jgi:2-polyprenyl-3-methyl-5-hydroxy-6-metoxy-1,4-benzoquinol methylase
MSSEIGDQSPPSEAIARQRAYYADTARTYDGMHGFEEHRLALAQVAAFLHGLGARTMLDTGCGTGLAMRYMAENVPELETYGNDPSAELLGVAHERFGIPEERLEVADSTKLPYADGQFDVVVETAVLHHVPDPAAVIAEMLRVARQAIFISDSNAYALGRPAARFAKLALTRIGLLDRVNRWRRGGTDWYYTEGDGVAWTYSVYDSLPQIRAACPEVIVIPTQIDEQRSASWPLLYSPHVLVAGFKQPFSGSQADR